MEHHRLATEPFVLDWQNGVGLVLSVLVAFISGPGGQGGGSFYIPLFSVLLGFTVNQAAALSSSVVFLGCITMVAQAVASPHPTLPGLPQVDYDSVLLMTPSLMLGLALGVLFNAIVSQWLLNLLVISVWTWSAVQLWFTYRRTRVREVALLAAAAAAKDQQEQQQQQQRKQQHEEDQPQQQQQQQQEQQQQADSAAAAASKGAPRAAACAALKVAAAQLRAWASAQPWGIMTAICILFGYFIASEVVRGAATVHCSPAYWGLFAALCGVSAAATVAVSLWMVRRHTVATVCEGVLVEGGESGVDLSAKAAAGGGAPDQQGSPTGATADVSPPAVPEAHENEHSVTWTPRLLAAIHPQMVAAGLMLGAWPLSPIVFALGLHPQVAAGTSKVMLFMIMGGAGLSFIAAGHINLQYLLAYGLTNAIATPIGVWVMDRIVARTGRPSYITLLTIARLAICVVIQLGFQAVPSLIELAHGLPRAGFMREPLCAF